MAHKNKNRKKSTSKSRIGRSSKAHWVFALLLVVIVVTSYAVVAANRQTDFAVSAAQGTTAHDQQLQEAELSQEAELLSGYDARYYETSVLDTGPATDVLKASNDDAL